MTTSVAKVLNSGQPRTNPASCQRGHETGTAGLRFWHADHSACWTLDALTTQLYCLIIMIGNYYFGGARSKGFATLRNVSKLQFFDKIGQAKSVGFRFYSAIWRSESRISSRYLEITLISLIYSLTFSRKKELLFWVPRGLNRLTCVNRQVRGDADCATATQGRSSYEK